MEFLKNRRNAILIFIVVVIVFSLFGAHRSLTKVCRATETAFFEKGMLSDYGAYAAPADQLSDCVNYANRLLSVINGSADLKESYAAIESRRTALAIALDSRDISAIYSASVSLTEAVNQTVEKVQAGAELPESSDDYDTIISDYFAAQAAVENSPYNTYVDDFIHTTIRSFPTGILRVISFVSLPEKYA